MKTVTRIQHSRMDRAKFAYSTSIVDRSSIRTLLEGEWKPRSGDLVLARIVEINQQKQLEIPNGRASTLFPGEEVVLCFGNRYAAEDLEAVVPHALEPCSLVAAGGIAAKMLSHHESTLMPTSIEPIGLLGDIDGHVLNLSQFSAPDSRLNIARPFTIAVAGTSVNSGTTSTAANLVRGMSRSGLLVGTARVTGTGGGSDLWHMSDAGAIEALDVTHVGMPSTYLASEEQVLRGLETLTARLANRGVDVIVLEISDSVYQKETSRLLQSSVMKSQVDSIIFTASDAMGAAAGVHWLNEQSLPIMAIAGELSFSPLAVREARSVTGLPILDSQSLNNTNWRFLLDNEKVEKRSQTEGNYRISIARLDAIMAMPVSQVN